MATNLLPYEIWLNSIVQYFPTLTQKQVQIKSKSSTAKSLNFTVEVGKKNDRWEFKKNLETLLRQKEKGLKVDSTLRGGKDTKIVFVDKFYEKMGLQIPINLEFKDDKPKTATTEQQELGSAYIFTQALVKNKKYKLPKGVSDSKNLTAPQLNEIFESDLPELKKIFGIPENQTFEYYDWLNAFYFQQKVLLEKYGSPKFSRFDRNGGFMDYISKLVKIKFGISKKDTWDPADVWAVDGSQSDIEKKINNELKEIEDYSFMKKTYANNPVMLENKLRIGIIKLNSVLIDLLDAEKVVGISLKLSDKGAHIEEINLVKVEELRESNKGLIDTVTDGFEVNPRNDFTCKFEIPQGKETFTQDVRVVANDKKNGGIFDFQIKANSSESTTGSNLKFEVTIKGMSKARGGKVPVDALQKLIDGIQKNAFQNEFSKFPRNVGEFNDKISTYKTMFQKLKTKGVDFGVPFEDTNTKKESFINNVTKAFTNKNKTFTTNATCKLMGFEFLYFLVTLSEDQMKELLTDMSFLAQKKNTRKMDTFGPFIKIA